jgi:hypothetical protein
VFVLVAFILLGFAKRGAAAVDTNAPVLASLAMTPTTVDTSAGPAVVTMTARLTDETSPQRRLDRSRRRDRHHSFGQRLLARDGAG